MAELGNYSAEINDFSKNAAAGMEFIGQLILLLAERSKGIVNDEDMMEMVKHLQNGGKCKTVTVPVKDMEHFTSLMKKYGVSYIPVQVPDPKTGEEMAIIAFRDTDQKAVNVVIDDYNRYCDGLVHELDQATFMDANREKGFFKVDGISKEELAVFRDEATKYNMDFMVTDSPTKPGTYMIYANNKTFLNRAVNDTLFAVSGKAGQKYMQEMVAYGVKQNEILKSLQGNSKKAQPYYVVDAANPSQIISMRGGQYSSHRCRIVEEEKPDGTVTRTPTDAKHEERGAVGEDVMNELRRMKQPVLLSQDEIKEMVTGVGRHGELLLTEAFADTDKLREWRQTLANHGVLDVQPPEREKEKAVEPGKLICYSNLPVKAIDALHSSDIEGITYNGGDIAYSPDLDERVQEVLEQSLYNGVSPLVRMQRDLEYRGRGQGRFQYLAPEEEYYLVDSAHPGATFLRFDHEGVSGYVSDGKEGVQYIHKDASAPDYEQCVLTYIATTSIPVVLSKDDIPSDYLDTDGHARLDDEDVRTQFAVIAQSRIPNPRENGAVQNLLIADDTQRETLNAYMEGRGELASPTDAQREVLHRRQEMQIEYEEPKSKEIDVEMGKTQKKKKHEQEKEHDDDMSR